METDWYCPACGRTAYVFSWSLDRGKEFYGSRTTELWRCECGAIIEEGYFIDKREMLDKMRERP